MTDLPEPPEHLTDAARTEWRRLIPYLADSLSPADRDTLAAYCIAEARWAQAEAEVTKLGPVVKSPAGFPVQNPWLAIADKAHRQMRRLAADLNLAERIRPTIPDLDDYLDGEMFPIANLPPPKP